MDVPALRLLKYLNAIDSAVIFHEESVSSEEPWQ